MQDDHKVRLDRWLWATRFYKTRSLAANAIKRGRIALNGRKAKPAKLVQPGDALTIRKAQLNYEVTVTALSEKRLSAKLAQSLYTELSASTEARELRKQEIRANRQTLIDGRPSKRDRRLQQAIKRQENNP